MIMEVPQLISCRTSMKSEILLDRVAPGGRAAGAGRRKALTVTTHHPSQRQ
jgi:hypothetical protein